MLQLPEVRERMVSQGTDPAFLGADAFAAFLAAQMPRWATAVAQSGAKLDGGVQAKSASSAYSSRAMCY